MPPSLCGGCQAFQIQGLGSRVLRGGPPEGPLLESGAPRSSSASVAAANWGLFCLALFVVRDRDREGDEFCLSVSNKAFYVHQSERL